MSRFSERLRECRLRKLVARPMTLYDLSEASGIQVCTLSRYETGKCEPKVTNLVKLAKALDITVEDLVEM